MTEKMPFAVRTIFREKKKRIAEPWHIPQALDYRLVTEGKPGNAGKRFY